MAKYTLESVTAALANCQRCGLSGTRTNIVVGDGPPWATVMFVGEGPGKNEDASGVPFVGAAGQLLDELLDLAKLERSEVYIANIIKCRPPGNRDPHTDEVTACSRFLKMQVAAIEPSVIVTLGNHATQFFLGSQFPNGWPGISKLRGKITCTGAGRNVFPMFHPAAALYDQTKLPTLRSDFVYLGQLATDISLKDCPF